MRVMLLVIWVVILTAGCIEPQIQPEGAEERAIEAEQSHIKTQLENASCLDNWSFQSIGVLENASVINSTAHAYYVEVTHPYSYNLRGRYGHAGSDATYRVTEDELTRVRGTTISPC